VRRVIAAVTDRPVDTGEVASCPLRDVFRVRADGSGLRQLTGEPGLDAAMGWSPDASRLAVATDRDLNVEIYTMAPDGSDLRRLTHDFAVDVFPAWSPDGRTIAFSREGVATMGDIFVMDADGSHQTRLTGFEGQETSPTWSPDGRSIAFVRVGEPGSSSGEL